MNQLTFSLPSFLVDKVTTTPQGLAIQAKQEMQNVNWGKRLFNIPQVWRHTQGAGVKVAVLDTGVDTSHPDLVPAIVDTCDFTGEGIQDGNGHGTHCAGIIAARAIQTNFVGVAPKAQLLIGKVLTNAGSGQLDGIAQAIKWAVEQGADIISMSLGGRGHSSALYEAVHQALAKGVIVICAGGNEGSVYQNSIGYPGKYGSVITIAACDRNGNASGFSSRGGEIDFMAPGDDIWSTYKDGGYAQLSGTSMATPFVAGLAALIEAKHHQDKNAKTPIQNNADMKNHLMVMATHPGWHQNDTGYGVLQPFRYFYPDQF